MKSFKTYMQESSVQTLKRTMEVIVPMLLEHTLNIKNVSKPQIETWKSGDGTINTEFTYSFNKKGVDVELMIPVKSVDSDLTKIKSEELGKTASFGMINLQPDNYMDFIDYYERQGGSGPPKSIFTSIQDLIGYVKTLITSEAFENFAKDDVEIAKDDPEHPDFDPNDFI